MRIPILMYHSVSDSDDYQDLPHACRPIGYRIGVGVFEDHLAVLKQDGWSTISLEELVSWNNIPEKAVVITFDDGYADNYHTALPLLLKYRFKATFFISVAYLGETGMMGGLEVGELLKAGMEIGSHGMGHDLLTGLSESDLSRELQESKRSLSERFSITSDFFSIPRGYLPVALPRLARAAGYRGICTSCPGSNTERTDPFALRRLPVRSSWKREELEAILAGKGRLYRKLLLIENIRALLRKRYKYKYLHWNFPEILRDPD
jgi:peptidoglycan/xylan/chitin deacetylase (PgdA/CDA1 family)